jgi:hypothetical protein
VFVCFLLVPYFRYSVKFPKVSQSLLCTLARIGVMIVKIMSMSLLF